MSDQAGVAHPASPGGVTDPASIDFAGDPTTDPGHLHTAKSAPGTLGVPSPTVVGPDTYGDAPAPGISLDFSRGDHDHGLPAAPSAGYDSLTGAGETATPGDLTQAGGFTVNDTAGDGIALISTGEAYMDAPVVELISPSSAGIGSGVTIQAQASVGAVTISAGSGGLVINITSGKIGFLGATPVVKQVSGGTLAGVIAGLVALGLFSS
jgi:hypothetical protein